MVKRATGITGKIITEWAGAVFGPKKLQKKYENESKTASRHEMASMMHICSGMVGSKSGNVKKPLVFKCFFEVSRET